MPLAPGSRLGSYEVLDLLGAGGMGEVYRARDSRLGREVAIKILPHDRVADETRRQRFIQEARAASALNHPHIVTIYEIESAGGIDFLVMEYVRGKTLDALIPRQGMRLGEALRIAIAVGDAVACAHQQNIVHRDLKPANVMVGTDGAVKVLDFGLAKLLTDDCDPDARNETRTSDVITAHGAVMGTLAYMAPEQASGGVVDTRSDVFSFGAMLYEMVTGERAFSGKTPTDTLAAVLLAQPKPPTALVSVLPHELERLILRCLRKEPARRFQHMLDVKVELQDIKEESESGVSAQTLAMAVPPRPQRRWWWVAGAAGVATALALAVWKGNAPPMPSPSVGLRMHVVPLTTMKGYEGGPSFSPDDSAIVFNHSDDRGPNANWGIYVTTIGAEEPRRLSPDHRSDGVSDERPSWSPDGRRIAFLRLERGAEHPVIYVMSPFGTGVTRVSDFPVQQLMSWSPDSRWIVAGREPTPPKDTDTGLYLIPMDGGSPRRVTSAHFPASDVFPVFSPNGRQLAYTACSRGDNCEIRVLDVAEDLLPVGRPRRVVRQWGADRIAWSHEGRSLVYGVLSMPYVPYIWRVDADGVSPPERLDIAGLGAWRADVSHKGDRVVFSKGRIDDDVYRFEPGRGSTPLLASSYADFDGQFSPDGRRIVFSTARSGEEMRIWIASASGGDLRQITHGSDLWHGSPHWSPDGRSIAYGSLATDERWHIWTVDADGGAPHQLTNGAGELVPTWSPDSTHVYYSGVVDDEHWAIWRVGVAGGPPQKVTTTNSGLQACEVPGASQIVYQPTVDDGPLLIAPIGGGPTRQIAKCALQRAFAVRQRDIYYVPCGSPDTLHVLSLTTEHDRTVGVLDGYGGGEFGVSPDGKVIVYRHVNPSMEFDLMMIENFK